LQFETAKAAAERLSVTPRAIQKWAKEGKIPNAYKAGRDWMIPVDAVKPADFAHKAESNADFEFPFMYDYMSGNLLNYIGSLEITNAKNIAMGEYYYFIGKLKDSSVLAEPYLNSKSTVLRTTAALFCIFSNLCRGHLHKSNFAVEIIMDCYKEAFEKNASDFEKAINVLSVNTLNIQLHLPLKDTPPLIDYVKFLPDDLKLFAFYLLAYVAYMNKEYQKTLGIVETAVNFSNKEYPISYAYLYIIKAIANINLIRVHAAEKCIEKAWEYLGPDQLIMPIVEHYNLMQGLIERYFKKRHPESYEKIIEKVKQYNLSWYTMRNQSTDFKIHEVLTPTEFTIAMLYSRNWRAKEIAAHMDFSERTIMNYIQVIYQKLQISGKKELEKYMLK